MNQVQVNQLSLEEKLGREKQLHSQLEPLKQQLATVRKTGPVNGISADALEGLIQKHEEHIGELRDSIDEGIQPARVSQDPDLKSKVDDYLTRHGKVHSPSNTVTEPTIETMSAREVSQVRLMQEAVTQPIFGNGRTVLDSWHKGERGQSYIQRTEDMKQGLFNLMAIRESA